MLPGESKPLGPDQRARLREELRATRTGLSESTIDILLALPNDQLIEILQAIVIKFGPLTSFSVEDYPFAANIDAHGIAQPDPIRQQTNAKFQEIVITLTKYNNLLQDKVSKFNAQTIRSLAAQREAAASTHDLTSLQERSSETKQRKVIYAEQIDVLKKSLNSSDDAEIRKLDAYHELFLSEFLSLNVNGTFFDKQGRLGTGVALGMGVWDEHDYVLEHIQRWKRLVNVDSPTAQKIIDDAREHVSQLVMCITHRCQVQLATVFSESQAHNTTQSSHAQAVHDEATNIIKEIDWLWEEVIPVAHMTVSAQFLRPVLNRFQTWDDSRKCRDAIVVTYAAGVLRFMNARLNAVAERTQILVYHHHALYNASWARQLKEASSTKNMVPHEMPQSMAHAIHQEHVNQTARETLQAFMQIYGVVPVDVPNPYSEPTPSLLDEYVQSRAEKGDTLVKDLHKLFEAAAKSGLTERELGGELLLESLTADTSANQSQPGSIYHDAQLEHSIDMLRSQAKQVQDIFKTLNLNGPAEAPDFVAHAYRQVAERLAAKVGERCFRGGENTSPSCLVCIRCLKFEEFVRKWGC